jgi:hypothetical protein
MPSFEDSNVHPEVFRSQVRMNTQVLLVAILTLILGTPGLYLSWDNFHIVRFRHPGARVYNIDRKMYTLQTSFHGRCDGV